MPETKFRILFDGDPYFNEDFKSLEKACQELTDDFGDQEHDMDDYAIQEIQIIKTYSLEQKIKKIKVTKDSLVVTAKERK